jgi:hypothetical protein
MSHVDGGNAVDPDSLERDRPPAPGVRQVMAAIEGFGFRVAVGSDKPVIDLSDGQWPVSAVLSQDGFRSLEQR